MHTSEVILAGLPPLPTDLQAHITAIDAHLRAVVGHPDYASGMIALGAVALATNAKLAMICLNAGMNARAEAERNAQATPAPGRPH